MLIKHLVELTNSRVCQIIMICRWFITKGLSIFALLWICAHFHNSNVKVAPFVTLTLSERQTLNTGEDKLSLSKYCDEGVLSIDVGVRLLQKLIYTNVRWRGENEWMSVMPVKTRKKQTLLLYFYFESDFKTKGIRNGKTFTKIGWKLLNGCQHRPCLTRKYGSTRVYWR